MRQRQRIKDILHHQLTDRERLAAELLFFGALAVLLFFFNAEELAGRLDNGAVQFFDWVYFNEYSHTAFFTIAGLTVIVFLCTGRPFPAFLIMEITTVVFGMANRYLYSYRREYLTIQSFQLMDEVKTAQIDFIGKLNAGSVLLLAAGIVFAIWSRRLDRRISRHCRKKAWMPAGRLFLSVIILIGLPAAYHKRAENDYFSVYHGIVSTGEVGCTVTFFDSIFWNSDADAVTYETLEEINAVYMEEAGLSERETSDARPDIIVIMSESFWNTEYLEKYISFSEDPMAVWRTLLTDGISGEMGVNIFGGGTVTTEFEFLTGINTYNLAGGADYYSEFFTEDQETFVSYLNELGYYSMAFHPYDGDFYERRMGYDSMGFEEFYDMETFVNREYYRGYISDQSLTDEIIYRYEQQKAENEEQPVFCFAVSIANHAVKLQKNIETEDDTYEERIHVNFEGLSFTAEEQEEITEYVNGIYEAQIALKNLTDYFSEQERETVIVFFGDHAPDLAETVYNKGGMQDSSDFYRTPYLIWSNIHRESRDYGTISSAYLSAVIMDYLKLPATRQFCMNLCLWRKYPVNTRYEMADAAGENLAKLYRSGEYNARVEEYIQDMETEKKAVTVICWAMKNDNSRLEQWKALYSSDSCTYE